MTKFNFPIFNYQVSKFFYLSPITYLNDCVRRNYIKNYERADIFLRNPTKWSKLFEKTVSQAERAWSPTVVGGARPRASANSSLGNLIACFRKQLAEQSYPQLQLNSFVLKLLIEIARLKN